jgi:hypothetical protein
MITRPTGSAASKPFYAARCSVGAVVSSSSPGFLMSCAACSRKLEEVLCSPCMHFGVVLFFMEPFKTVCSSQFELDVTIL